MSPSLISAPRLETALPDFENRAAVWIWRGQGCRTVAVQGRRCGFVGTGFEPGDHPPELRNMFPPRAQGRGFATEAATRARDFAKSRGLHSLVSYISDANAALQQKSEQ